MFKQREKITFWIQLLSFIGSIVFLIYAMFMEKPHTDQEKDCITKMLYYQHRSDSLQGVLDTMQQP